VDGWIQGEYCVVVGYDTVESGTRLQNFLKERMTGSRGFSHLRNVETGSGAHPAPRFNAYREFFLIGESDRGVKQTKFAVPTLRMHGVLPPFRQMPPCLVQGQLLYVVQ
jgi:hypothetical protein